MSEVEVAAGPEAIDPAAAVALVGMALRVPGASDPESFWRNLSGGVESIRTFTDAELERAGVPAALIADPALIRSRGLVDGIDRFDAAFFDIAPREAELLDPQHRIFLEIAWEALEAAGYAPGASAGLVGVFAGCGSPGYLWEVMAAKVLGESAGRLQIEIGNDRDHFAAQVSYRLDLRGPSLTLQTGCSTSLVAVHVAAQSLLAYECDLALAGGVSITLPEIGGSLYREGGVLAPDGHCRAFDAAASGTVNGSGAAVVVLKRLDEALADGDSIRAVIRGSAINNDGARKIGYTAPSVAGQADAISQALANARLSPRDVSYVEAHGTATPVGDPIEIAALHRVFRDSGKPAASCAIGSVKTNLGHLNAAAGAAGLIKAALMLERRTLVPSLHYERPNPEIDFAAGPLFVNTETRAWRPPGGGLLRAGVSSFSIGGTNAHVVLEEAPRRPEAAPAPAGAGPQLLVLSAKTEEALERATDALAADLVARADLAEADLGDVAFTLQAGRRAFPVRRFTVASETGEAARALVERTPGRVRTAAGTRGSAPPIAFLLPGQGIRAADRGGELYAREPVFRRAIDGAAEILAPLGCDLLAALAAPGLAPDETSAADPLLRTEVAQPWLLACEIALARLWESWGIRPSVLLGHSLGEIAAAVLAGTFDFAEALDLVALRGRLLADTPEGAMLAVALPEAEVAARLPADLALAAINGAAAAVVSGPAASAAAFEADLAAAGIAVRRLPVRHAFHSPLAAAVAPALVEKVAAMRRREPKIRWISNLDGRPVDPATALDPEYWGRHLTSPVRFADGLDTLGADPAVLLLEVGPGDALSRLARRHFAAAERPVIASLPPAEGSEDARLRGAAGALWLEGCEIRWPALHAVRRRRVPLPTYPFERQRHWVARAGAAESQAPPQAQTFAPRWRRAARPGARAEAPGGAWLVFARSEEGLGERFAARLEARGERVFRLLPRPAGSGFARLGERAFGVRPAERNDYAELFSALREVGELPRRIVHFWTAETEGAEDDGPERLLDLGFWSGLALAQALADVEPREETRWTTVTRGAVRVGGEGALRPEVAAVLGPCRTAPKEIAGLVTQLIDVEPLAAGGWREERLLARLADDVAAASPAPAIAYRGLERWEESLEPCALPPAEGSAARRAAGGGTVAILGGLRGIGFAIARALAALGEGARLALFEPDSADPSSASEDERRLADLAALGATVRAVRGVSGAAPADLERALAEAAAELGPIRGAIHAEAPSGSGLIPFRSRADAARTLALKIEATRVLAASGDALDFLALGSSAFAAIGGVGLADACAADAWADAFAQSGEVGGERRARVLSLGWGVWRDGEAGAESAVGLREHLDRARREEGFGFDEAAEIFLAALDSDEPQVILAKRDLRRQASAAPAAVTAWRAEEPESASRRARHERPKLATAFAGPLDAVEAAVAGVVAELFGFDRVGRHDNFFELGGHSLMAVQLVNRLRRRFEVDLPLASVFEAPTVAGLGERISSLRLGAEEAREIEEMLREIESLPPDEVARALADESKGSAANG
ncbi:MAG TPA: beta-ketoacyl synthase N-terminal-like domain-containing protein [Thermoanaerobaculia bacterium]|nr:beta-ketoacyl synthase N-terminal-like domain-containing protein [Thermoanaerobaculia bacterium]